MHPNWLIRVKLLQCMMLYRSSLFLFLFADFINIGWDAPAGQMYASANDLSKLMSLIFRPLATFDPEKGQVGVAWSILLLLQRRSLFSSSLILEHVLPV